MHRRRLPVPRPVTRPPLTRLFGCIPGWPHGGPRTQAPRHAIPSCWRRATATCSSTGWPTCRCGRSPRRSDRAPACCSTSSTARTASSAPCWHVLVPTSSTSSPASARRTGRRTPTCRWRRSPSGSGPGWPPPSIARCSRCRWRATHGPWSTRTGRGTTSRARRSRTGWPCCATPNPPPNATRRRGGRAAPRCWPSCVVHSSTCSPPATSNGPPARSATISERRSSRRMPSNSPRPIT